MKKILYFLIFSVLFCGSINICKNTEPTESFVIKKKKKKKSKSKLQEQLCTSFANQMATVPDVHKKIADVQQLLLDQTCKYLENQKCCIILNADKTKVDQILKIAKDFEKKIEQFCSECDEYLEYLKNL